MCCSLDTLNHFKFSFLKKLIVIYSLILFTYILVSLNPTLGKLFDHFFLTRRIIELSFSARRSGLLQWWFGDILLLHCHFTTHQVEKKYKNQVFCFTFYHACQVVPCIGKKYHFYCTTTSSRHLLFCNFEPHAAF